MKIAPDLADTDIDEIADLAVELGLAGIVATNTTVSRDGLRTPGVEHWAAAASPGRRWPAEPAKCFGGCTAGSATG